MVPNGSDWCDVQDNLSFLLVLLPLRITSMDVLVVFSVKGHPANFSRPGAKTATTMRTGVQKTIVTHSVVTRFWEVIEKKITRTKRGEERTNKVPH